VSAILVFPSLIAPIAEGLCYGGAEIAALDLAESLALSGHRVMMIGVSGSRARGVEIIESEGTPPFVPGERASEELGPFPELERRIEALAAREEIAALHLHLNDPQAFELADRVARRHPLRVVSTLHLSAVFPSTTEVVRRLAGEGTPIRFATPSVFAARSYGVEMEVIPNGIPISKIAFVSEPSPDGRLAWAGRRVPEKGLDLAIAVAKAAARPLSIAGPGRSPRAGVDDLGMISRLEVARLFSRSSAVLVTSRIAEAHPLVAIEALAAGTPVVGFDVGGLGEIIDHGRTGFLVAPGDVAAAAAAVARIHEIDRTVCRREAERRFDHDLVTRAYERLLLLS
jgi:UDP-glucose:tetrahydrobiopterin glucosyltransferase